MISQLQSFYKRRISIPVKKGDIVLDIGSGDKPHWRADVLVDLYTDDSFGIQRSGSNKIKVTKPLIIADIEKLPFKDKSFDYIICSHVIEHVVNPRLAFDEIIRVGKAGYIEVPFEGASKVIDYPSHLWYCRLEGKRIILTAKRMVYFDNQIDKLMRSGDIINKFASIGQENWDKFIVTIRWRNSFDYRIKGEASKKLIKNLEKEEALHNYRNFFFRTILNNLFSLIYLYKKNWKEIKLEEIMQCPNCNGSYKKIKSVTTCNKCGKKLKILV